MKSAENQSAAIVFPDVCKVPAPPAPFAPIPYPNVQYEQNLKQANRADARAKKGDKFAQKAVSLAIESAYKASLGDEAGTAKGTASNKRYDMPAIQSATQAVMYGRTMHTKYNTGNAPPGTRIVPSQIKVMVP
jgi:hypothetical protein